MDHHYIEENNIADRYAMGKLSAPERVKFEEHFIGCQKCLDRLELTEVFCRAVDHALREEVQPPDALLNVGLFTRLARLSPRLQATLFVNFALVLAILIVAIVAQFFENRRLNQELNSANIHSLPQPAPNPSAAEERKNATSTVESPTVSSPSTRPTPYESIKALRKLSLPQTNVPIFTLHTVRNAAPNLSAPVNKIEVPSSPRWLIFSVELDDKPKHPTYRAAIFTANGRCVWESGGLRPNQYDAFVLSFPSNFFQPRDYSIVLEGITPDGEAVLAGSYSFRVTRKIS